MSEVPVSSEVAHQMFEDAEPGTPEYEEAIEARAQAYVRDVHRCIAEGLEAEDDN